ncbi:MAG: nitrate- and nitrite sensing domain-containing protein, partial [Nocardiopsaceae bacterium]|nr:nitrate- and nitrite sensing domain-containing protein [Nocardiopsaceae bacterium]
MRRRSIRAMLTPLFVVPLVSLIALWGFAASGPLLNALREHDFTTENQRYGGQAQALGLQLAQERSAVFVWLSNEHHQPATALTKQIQMTDGAIAAFQRGVHSGTNMSLRSAGPALASFDEALGKLDNIRAKVVSRRIGALGAFEAYNAIIDSQFRLYNGLIEVDNSTLLRQATASLTAGRALEMADREVTLVNGALANGGHMTRGERLLFAATVANQRLLIDDALKELDPALASGYRDVYTSPAYKHFSAIEDRIVSSIGYGGSLPVTRTEWSTTAFSLLGGFQKAELKDRAILARNGTAIGNRLLLEVLLAGGLGLIAVVLSVILMIRFGRRITRELTSLQRSAQELATERLPSVVEQLSHGEDIDAVALPAITASATAGPVTATSATTRPATTGSATTGSQTKVPPAVGRIVETAKVAEAFAAVQSTAIEAAVGQARLRRGVSQVFRNMAWRSQALLHRQLDLLDRMERTTTDAGTLEELFQLDHLTTRMRRHAEGLIILSGEAPGRGWREPVPVVDVLRAAVAEVEDYTRVGVLTRNTDALAGVAVADVIHLLAELIENATTSSPANTEITVRAERVAHGIVVEVEDRGLGMTDEDMELANDRFANPPEFDLADSDKLGFFVVARLAARHNIKITLRMSPYGGVSAIVLLPHTITVTPDAEDNEIISSYPDPLGLPP